MPTNQDHEKGVPIPTDHPTLGEEERERQRQQERLNVLLQEHGVSLYDRSIAIELQC